jgi:hypothetical protein
VVVDVKEEQKTSEETVAAAAAATAAAAAAAPLKMTLRLIPAARLVGRVGLCCVASAAHLLFFLRFIAAAEGPEKTNQGLLFP